MTVRELIEWLKQYPNQDANVLVVVHRECQDYRLQGGVADCVDFDPNAASPTYEGDSDTLTLGRFAD
jgi:hypothetical protein